jgi:integrase
MPLLAYFTGCRLGELAQLHLEDFKENEGIWVIDINTKGDKGVKTTSSIRQVPIHSFLLKDLSLLSYVEYLRSKGETRLFPELHHRRDGYGQTVSKWFSRYRDRCGVDGKGGRKVFHSFRHTLIDKLKQDLTVNDTLISELVGHSVDSITMGRYGKRYRPKLLKDVVEKLKFDFPTDHFRNSKYVVKRNEKQSHS